MRKHLYPNDPDVSLHFPEFRIACIKRSPLLTRQRSSETIGISHPLCGFDASSLPRQVFCRVNQRDRERLNQALNLLGPGIP